MRLHRRAVTRPAAVCLATALLAGLTACSSGDVVSTAGPTAGPAAGAHHARTALPGRSPTASAPPSATPSVSPTPSASPTFDTWVVGATPLPLRADGFGEVRPTPPQLRVRRLPTEDLLPPPTDGQFHAVQRPVTQAFADSSHLAWFPGCPVALGDLRLLQLSFWGFDDQPHTGQLVVNASVADDVESVFRTLYSVHFPIEEMRLVTKADLDAPPTGDGNVTAAYACRPVRGSTQWSAHAYGLAIDVNPFMNPYRNDDLVLPELASAYLDRSWRRPGMIFADGPVVQAFSRVGWTWGGTFQSVLDLQHFSANGR